MDGWDGRWSVHGEDVDVCVQMDGWIYGWMSMINGGWMHTKMGGHRVGIYV
jgi:hypothetical protein